MLVSQVRNPYVDPECWVVRRGAGENAGPVQDRPAVYVASVGESRSKTNQFILGRAKKE